MTNESSASKRRDDLDVLRVDLVAEQEALDDVVANITDEQWLLSTPSPGWNVRDQIAHLTYFDHSGATAILQPARFHESVDELVANARHGSIDEFTLGPLREHSPHELLGAWRRAREHLNDAASSLDVETRVAWYGPSMGAKSFLSARLMEVWAHGTDVVDALGAKRSASDRLRHVAQLGFITRTWSYLVRGEEVPEGEVRLELSGPSGDLWIWGPSDAADLLQGSAEDFALVVTQRRHVDDTSLKTGELGHHWLVRAQAFAGGRSDGPEPRSS
ncbi:MAG TPA: TIGR03084 family metal-binding protein [Acidimicrobiales bacterium]|nr:TIGR03084 family metal-binding protein [Acidimicrobiales bacterium]